MHMHVKRSRIEVFSPGSSVRGRRSLPGLLEMALPGVAVPQKGPSPFVRRARRRSEKKARPPRERTLLGAAPPSRRVWIRARLGP